MDLLDSVRTLVNRWWLTLPLLLITISGVVAGVVVLPWTYTSEATVVFLASRLQAKDTGGNPWLAFDASLAVTAEVVGREMMDDDTVAELRARGNTAGYQVGPAPDSAGPVLVIEVASSDPVTVQNTLDAVLNEIPVRLREIQDQGGVPPQARIRPSVVSASEKAKLAPTDKIRTLAMALFAGLVVTVGVPLFVDSLAARRRSEQTDGWSPSAGANGRARSESAAEWAPYPPAEPVERVPAEPVERASAEPVERASAEPADRSPAEGPHR